MKIFLLLHRHSPRLRPRRFLRDPLRAEARGTALQESFTTWHTHPSRLPPSPPRSLRQERNRYPVGSLEILQVSRPRLLCLLQCAPSRHLHPSPQTPTPRLFQTVALDQDEMLLQQYPQSRHVQFRKKPRPPLLQMCQAPVRFLPVGR